MNRTKQERLYLTKKYQDRQIRLNKVYNGEYIDTMRRPIASLMYALGGFDAWRVGHWDYQDEPSPERMGKWKDQSFRDCGKAKCIHCGNPRTNGFYDGDAKITIQERKSNEDFNDQLADYYYGADYGISGNIL